MKKNAMLKIAAVLLVAVLLTTCAISSTFAKYVSGTEQYKDTARVAKWGLTIDTETTEDAEKTALDSGFENNYNDKVVSSDGKNVVAPGTKGQIVFTFKAMGTAEVDAVLRLTDAAGKCAADAQYIKVDSGLVDELLFYIEGAPKTVAEVNEEIYNLCATQKYEAGSAVAAAKSITIDWIWAFDGGDDGADTNLGNTAYNNVTSAATVTIEINAQLVQDGPAVDGATSYPAVNP